MIDPSRLARDSAVGRSRRRRLRLTLSLWLAILVVAVGAAAAREHWLRLREGLDEMRSALVDARERQQALRLRVATAEAELREQLDRLGLDVTAGDGPAPLAAPPNSRPATGEVLVGALSSSTRRPAIASRLAGLAADLNAGGEAQAVANTLRRLAAEVQATDRAAGRRQTLLVDELNGLAAALAASPAIDWTSLRARLDTLIHEANRLPPPRVATLVERPVGAPGWGVATAQHPLGPWSSGRSNRFRWAMHAQLEVAESAVQWRDLALLRLSGAGVERLLQAHYPADSAETVGVARQLRALRQAVKAMDRDAMAARIEALADVLAETEVDRVPAAAVSVPAR